MDRLLLITGAGASRALGTDDRPMPLMPDWAQEVRQALDRSGLGTAQALGLRQGQTGPEFETAVGDFLKWQRVLPLAARFLPLGFDTGRAPDAGEWQRRAQWAADAATAALRTTLYDQFSGSRINPIAARDAYAALIDMMQLNPLGGSIAVATTNYDPAAELALAELDRRPDVGDVPAAARTRRLEPENLIARCDAGRGTAVLHLHGKVGWYTQPDGTVAVVDDHHPLNESTGTPTLLMPDPDKDPLAEPAIRLLWAEFDAALRQATHVLFLGHSLHDPVLLEHVRRQAGGASIGVSVLPDADQAERDRVRSVLPQAKVVGLRFGPAPEADGASLSAWRSPG